MTNSTTNSISKHKIISIGDYSFKGKLKRIIIGWAVLIIVYAVTRIPSVQEIIIRLGSSTSNFIIEGLKFLFVPWIFFTVVTVRKEQKFDTVVVYSTGIGFIDNGKETFASYDNIQLNNAQMGQAFTIECEMLGIKYSNYAWKEFENADILRNNLERYAIWGFHH